MMVECMGHNGQGVWDVTGKVQWQGVWNVVGRACVM